jgi:hypothetical protein
MGGLLLTLLVAQNVVQAIVVVYVLRTISSNSVCQVEQMPRFNGLHLSVQTFLSLKGFT